jgi:hypothetical protein
MKVFLTTGADFLLLTDGVKTNGRTVSLSAFRYPFRVSVMPMLTGLEFGIFIIIIYFNCK